MKWLAGALVDRNLDVLGVKTAPVEEVFGFRCGENEPSGGRMDVMMHHKECLMNPNGKEWSLTRFSLATPIITRQAGGHHVG